MNTPDPADVIANIAVQRNRDGTPMRMLVDRADADVIVEALAAAGLRVVPVVDDDVSTPDERRALADRLDGAARWIETWRATDGSEFAATMRAAAAALRAMDDAVHVDAVTEAEMQAAQFLSERDAALVEVARLREGIEQAVSELDSEHRPQWSTEKAKADGKEPIGCLFCWPGDGRWPCISRMIADDLRALLDTERGTE